MYTVSNATFQQAMEDAIDRFSRHWAEMNWNLWTSYNDQVNVTWWDPWYENDTTGIYNGPSTGADDPAYEMTQNAFGVWNWYKYKGYSEYAITALLTAHTQESTVTGGLWESGLHPYAGMAPSSYLSGSYGALEGYNAEATGASPSNYTWYLRGGGIVPAWTATAVDEYDQQTYTLTAAAGSWDAVNQYPLQMEAETIGGQVYIRVVQPPQFNRLAPDPVVPSTGRGYGLVQWTPSVELVKTAELAFPGFGGKHWQLNLTLQLMVLEYERAQAMSGDPQTGPDYRGQWVDSNATQASLTVEIGGVQHTINYPVSCTWDFWAGDGPAAFYDTRIRSLGGTPTDWDLVRGMMDLFRVCYLHTSAGDFGFEEKSAFWLAAIRYWSTNDGYDPAYIPRARDLPSCELDKFHITPALLGGIIRRRQTGGRTILF